MAVSTINVLHGINTPSSFYSQITESRVNTGIEMLSGMGAGFPQPLFKAVQSQNADVTFTTSQLATLFVDCTSANMFADDLSGGNTDLHLKKATNFGIREADAGLLHERFRMAQAYLVAQSVSAPHNAEATAQCRLLPTYDGTNEPIVPAGSLALAGTASSAEHFGGGPVFINGAELPGVQQWDLDFGIVLYEQGADSEAWISFTGVQEYNPVATIRTLTATSLTTYGFDGSALSAAAGLYLRKMSEDGTRVAEATTEHIKFFGSSGMVTVQEVSGGGNDPVESQVQIHFSGANTSTDAITVDAAIAITS